MCNNKKSFINASVAMTGVACIMMLVYLILKEVSPDYDSVPHRWAVVFSSMITPIFSFWIGMLLRRAFPHPKWWVQAAMAAVIPALYLLLPNVSTAWVGYYGWRGQGIILLWISLIIVGFLIPERFLERVAEERGWLCLALFAGAAFCYLGAEFVSNHFSVANFSFRESGWARLFIRLMRVVPLAMSLFFLAGFSFSKVGQRLGGMKWFRGIVLVLVIYHFLDTLVWIRYFRPLNFTSWRILLQPVTIYLLVVIFRLIRRICRDGWSWKVIFGID